MSSFMQLQRSRISCNRRQRQNRVQVKWDMSFESRGTRVIFGRMRAWLRTQLERQIQDVPPELACCEFQCRVTRCDGLRFNNCQRRIAYRERGCAFHLKIGKFSQFALFRGFRSYTPSHAVDSRRLERFGATGFSPADPRSSRSRNSFPAAAAFLEL